MLFKWTGRTAQQAKMKLLVFFMIFFILAALLIISNNNLALYKKENVEKFSGYYYSWISELYSNISNIVQNILNTNWLPSKV